MSYVLGISCGYHDSTAVLLKDGDIIAAVQEERFTRIKQDHSFPANAIKSCLTQGAISLGDVTKIFYYENPVKKFQRIVSTYLNFGLPGYTSFVSEMPSWITNKIYVKRTLSREFARHIGDPQVLSRIEYIDHHESHAASAFFPSPYQDAVILCVDGVGEKATTSAWVGDGNTLKNIWDIQFPHSLGLLYSAVTYFCGFKVDSGEYKLMGLAPYGQPVFAQRIKDHLIDVKSDGSFWLNMEYFDYAVGDSMTNDKFAKLFDGPRRVPEGPITSREFDLAASVQVVLEEVLLRIAQTLRQQTGKKNLCMAGGVALNCVANGKLLDSGIFDNVWVQPASSDSGGALGAALAGWHLRMQKKRAAPSPDTMKSTLLGTSYNDAEIETALDSYGAVYTKVSDADLYSHVAKLLDEGNVVGWFQGRMEFGPRALGSRSILGDARNAKMQTVMNMKIKNRESFRPFAPAVLAEHAEEWFKIGPNSPYMLFVVGVQDEKRKTLTEHERKLTGLEGLKCERSAIPAVTHIDYSARVQTVSAESGSRFRKLLEKFYERTACPVLVNTSFNVRGEPIVESPSDAYRCFMRTQMDYLIVGNYIICHAEQPPLENDVDWRAEFVLD